MTYDVNFFTDQFLHYFVAATQQAAKIGKLLKDESSHLQLLNAMALFPKNVTPESLNALSRNSMVDTIGIEFTSVGPDFIEARMPVDTRTQQPLGLLHGGASVALAETLGSVAASCCVDNSKQFCVGLEINANHIKGVRNGYVKGTTKPVHIGKKTQVWEIRIVNEQQELTCICRITLAVLDKKT